MHAEKTMYSIESHSVNAVNRATTFQIFMDLKIRMTPLKN